MGGPEKLLCLDLGQPLADQEKALQAVIDLLLVFSQQRLFVWAEGGLIDFFLTALRYEVGFGEFVHIVETAAELEDWLFANYNIF